MGWIFDRADGPHPWAQALDEMERHPEAEERAVAGSWRMDHRVSLDREQDTLGSAPFSTPPPNGSAWKGQVNAYFRAAMCRPSASPEGHDGPVCFTATNHNNRLPGQSVPGHDQLIHLGSLGSLLRFVFREENRPELVRMEFRSAFGLVPPQPSRAATAGPGPSSGNDLDGFVDQMGKLPLERRRKALEMLLEALGNTQPPWWAAYAEDLRPWLQDQDPLVLCQALGLGHFQAGEWVLAWRYPLAQVDGPMVRPTVLEANLNPYHFPSPPDYAYGVAMPLAPGLRRCREVLHAPLPSSRAVQAWDGEFRRLGSFPVAEPLADLRARHKTKLGMEFKHSAKPWLERHRSTP